MQPPIKEKNAVSTLHYRMIRSNALQRERRKSLLNASTRKSGNQSSQKFFGYLGRRVLQWLLG